MNKKRIIAVAIIGVTGVITIFLIRDYFLLNGDKVRQEGTFFDEGVSSGECKQTKGTVGDVTRWIQVNAYSDQEESMTLHAYDAAGAHVGPNDIGGTDEYIVGGDYDSFGSKNQFINLLGGWQYRVEAWSQRQNTVELSIEFREFVGQKASPITEEPPLVLTDWAVRAEYEPVTLKKGSKAVIIIPFCFTEADLMKSMLRVDEGGDGSYERISQPRRAEVDTFLYTPE